MAFRRVMQAILLATSFAVPLQSQAVPIGSRIRVWSPDLWVKGWETTVVGGRGDTIVLHDQGDVGISRSSLTRVDLRLTRPASRKRTAAGVALGMVSGVLLGSAVAAASAHHARANHDCPDGMCEMVVMITVPVGIVAGAILGRRMVHSRSMVWQRVSDPRGIEIVPPRQ